MKIFQSFDQLADVPYFTYFKGPADFIFYSCGRGSHSDKSSLRSVMVYYPDINGDREQYVSTQKYSRFVVNGFQEDKLKISLLPKKMRITLLNLFDFDLITKEPILEVPLLEVKEVYDPKQVLKNLLTNPPALHGMEMITERLKYGVNLLNKAGIPTEDLGLYGSLQCGIFHRNLEKNFNDIDFLIYGLKHQEKIVSLASKYKFSKGYKKIDEKDDPRTRVKKRNIELTEVHLQYKSGSIRLCFTQLREKDDKFSFPDISTLEIGDDTIDISGEVVDSSEGFTCPSVFKVKTSKGVINVLNRHYCYVKAAYKGDKVKARGRIDKKGQYLIITDPIRHYILVT